MPDDGALRWTRIIAIGECMVEMAPREAGGYDLGFAGDTFNTAWYLRALSGPDVAIDYLTAIGSDVISDKMLAFMQSEGIGTGLVERRTDATVGLYLVTLENGERDFSYWRENAAARHLDRCLDALEGAGPGTLLYFSGITLAILSGEGRAGLLSCLSALRATGCALAFDPNIRPRLWEDQATLHHWIERAGGMSDIVFPSADDEAKSFADQNPLATATRYRRLGAACVVVKDGSRPVLLCGADGVQAQVAPSPVIPVDTTSAGDAFNAGFIAAFNAGAAYDAALTSGCDVAARVVRGRGALVAL